MLKLSALLLATFVCYNHAFSHSLSAHIVAESEAVLDPEGALLLKWRVDYTTEKIYFQILISEKAPALNWFALGFSDQGDLENADICLVWTDYKGKDHYEDMHSDEEGRLERDVEQNCNKFYVDIRARSVYFERHFDTCDDDDYIIEDETVHVVWARGTDKLYTSTGLCLPCASSKDRGFIRVRLLTPPAQPKPPAKELHLSVQGVKVPGTDTTYWCKVVRLPKYVSDKPHHIVQFESAITAGNEGLVHHMEVFYCDAAPTADIPLYEGNCFSEKRPSETKVCSKVKAAWAMGAPPFVYPEEAGLPLGGPTANKYVMLEIHYNNPQMKSDWVDSSGFVLRVTSQRRTHDAAIMELGLEYTDKMAVPGGQRAFSLAAHCVPQCTGVGLPHTGITVFGSQLHTHLTGAAVWTRHIRAGTELPMLNKDMHYSTHFQEIRILHRPVTVFPNVDTTGAYHRFGNYPGEKNRRKKLAGVPLFTKKGDYLQTTCVYNTLSKRNATIGGHAITDEMCVNYIHYYPATQLEVCKSAVSNAALEGYFRFEKEYDYMPISYTASPRHNYLSIQPWTPLRAAALHGLYTESPISMQCNRSDGNRFQGDWEGIRVPKIRFPLPPKRRNCPRLYE